MARSFVLWLYISLLAFFSWGAAFLSIDPNNRAFFAETDVHYARLLDLEARFGSNTNLFFVVAAEDSLFENADLHVAVRWLADEVWRIDKVVSVDSLAGYPKVIDDGEEFSVLNLLDYVCPRLDAPCLAARAGALSGPHVTARYVDKEASAVSVVANVDLSNPSPDDVVSVAREARALIEDFRARYPASSIYLTGGIPMMNAFFEAAKNDSATLLVAVVLVLTVALYVFLGGFVPTLAMVLLGISSVVVAMGTAGWFGHIVNTATATVPLVVYTLVVASSMHVFLHIVREEQLDAPERVFRAIQTAISANWRPVVLTTATTVVGLLSMTFVSAPPLRQLGVFSAIGVAAGALMTLTVIPSALSYLGRIRASDYLLSIQTLMNRYARWVEWKRPTMLLAMAGFGVALVGLSKLSVDEDFVRYFSSDTSFRQDTEAITDKLAGPYHIDLVYDSAESAGVYLSTSIRDLEAITQHLRAREDVVNVVSVVDVLREVASVMAGRSDLDRMDPAELAQYFLSYELSLGMGQSTRDLLDADHRLARMSVLLDDVTMADIRALVQDVEDWLGSQNLEDQVVVSGEGVPTAFLSSNSIREMAMGIAASVFLSAALVGLYFRDAKAAISILAATGIPILAGFGVWGWIESDIGMAATLVVATTIGVVIDDTIHLTYRYVDSLRNLDLTPWGATAYSIHKTGTAILITSVVLVAGLILLVVSDFRMNSTFGVCSSLIVSLALLYNLTVAPRLLNQLR